MIMISECKDTKTPENTHYPNYRKNELFSLFQQKPPLFLL